MAKKKIVQESGVDVVDVLSTGQIQVRRSDRVLEDGKLVSLTNLHRHVLAPGDDLSNEPPEVVEAAKKAWTKDVVAKWRAHIDETHTALEKRARR